MICNRCQHCSFYIEITVDKDNQSTHAKYVDECDKYPEMVGKIRFKEECPHFEQRWQDESEEDDDTTIQ